MKPTSYQSPLSILISLLTALSFWVLFAPTQLGGQVTYIIVDGNSMEPKFKFGDLVLMREQSAYQPGDAVTYQNAEMGRLVFHRIVATQLEHFVLQGDHNTWLDNYQPEHSEIIGKLWIHIPWAGKFIQWVRTPLGLALGCGIVGGMMTVGLILNPSQSKKRKLRPQTGQVHWSELGLYMAGSLLVLFVGMAVFAFTRPLTRPSENLSYQQDTSFVYSAAGTPGVYDSTTIQPGEPIFPKLTCFLNIGVVYNASGNGLQNVSGTQQLQARIFDEKSGWQRTLPLTAAATFAGSGYSSQAGIDLCQVMALVESVEQQTGLHPNLYTMEVIAYTSLQGMLAGQPISDSSEAALRFQFDKVNFHLSAEAEQADPLHTSKTGMVSGSSAVSNELNLFGLRFPVSVARGFSMAGLFISLCAGLLVGWQFLGGMQSRPVDMIRLKYRGLLVDARQFNAPRSLPIMDVASVDDLARLAERHGTVIVHLQHRQQDTYLVQTQGMLYRHTLGTRPLEFSEIERTQPRLALPLPEQTHGSFLEALPLDTEGYGYRVEIPSRSSSSLKADQTVLLGKIKL